MKKDDKLSADIKRIIDAGVDDIEIFMRGLAYQVEAQARKESLTKEELDEVIRKYTDMMRHTIEMRDNFVKMWSK